MNNKKIDPKQYITIGVVYAAVFAIYNIIVLLLFSNKNDIFWISYGFMCAAFVANIVAMYASFKSADAEAIFMGIPLFSFSVFYFFGELFISFVFMLFKGIAPPKLAVAIQVIFLLVFVIFAALALLTRNIVDDINKNVESKVRDIKNVSVDVKILEEQCMDKELKNELHKVYEAIRYSDPMTTDAVADLDDIIKGKVKELRMHCNNSNKNEALQACYQLSSYISERNQRLILSK